MNERLCTLAATVTAPRSIRNGRHIHRRRRHDAVWALLDVDIKTMTRQATEAALADAGLEKSQLQAAYFANVSQGHMERQHMIRGEIALRSMGIGGIPVVNIENACASGSTAFNTAVNYVKAGQGDVALAVGAEKM